ncbi:LLM class flavin-dependent oxidoreductase [Streptomyces gilvus]|uniref:LLM class flavin-dependent oxidoreductase n=1 Tax=Streptomyces gilvus TaxID=2920937 RepID=UPI001F107349|nr:LLM class flavin-dependent oxidoreductase [Streptomyces sp. CME 23]MCH5677634.1 LLM class flavin-dependent oxidoreductase [Streptomyces sp. CME 23]
MSRLGSVPLSVLDLATVSSGSTDAEAVNRSVSLAQHVEGLGYQRFWTAEHHNIPSVASSAPDLLALRVADATSTIRVGAGGVMLPNHSPLQVAERYLTLEAFHPGRIDLGLGRAPGTDRRTAHAVRRSEALDFGSQIDELTGFLDGALPPGHRYEGIRALPQGPSRPTLWLLGSSLASASLAAARGERYVFAAHLAPHLAGVAVQHYREQFRPSAALQQPYAIASATVIAAEDDMQADRLAGSSALGFVRTATGRPQPIPSPEEVDAHRWTDQERAVGQSYLQGQIIGGPKTVEAGLSDLLETTGADELMITATVHSADDHRRSFEIIAEAAAGTKASR